MALTDAEITENAIVLIREVRKALAIGTKHYRRSDGKLLGTELEIITALSEEKVLDFKPPTVH